VTKFGKRRVGTEYFIFLLFPLSFFYLKEGFFRFFFSMYVIQHCFICRPLNSTVSGDAGIDPKIVETLALAARRFSNLAQSPEHKICILEAHRLWI